MTVLRVPKLNGDDTLPEQFFPDRLADASIKALGTGNPYHRRVVHQLPIRFPGYSTIIAAKSYDYLFPQSFVMYEDRIYILYGGASNSGTNLGSWVSVHNLSTGVYISGFSLPGAWFGEGLAVTRTAGVLYLYAMHVSNTIGRWDITALPANQATLLAPTTYDVGLQSQFTYDGDKFTIQTRGDNTGVRHRFTRYNSDLVTFNSNLVFDPSDAWPVTADLIPLNVKAQGITTYRGGYAMIYGGTHYFGGTLSPDKRPGIRLFTDSGEKTVSALMDPDSFITILRAAGVTADLIEGEGIASYNGGLYALWVTSSHTNTGAYGLLITQELEGDIDCSSASRRGTLANLTRHNGRIAASSDGVKNPISGVAFTSLTEIIEFMRDTDTNRYGIHTTGSTPITDVAGNPLPSGCLVEITTGNFFSWTITIRGLTRHSEYWVSGNEGGLTQAMVFDRRTGPGDPEGNVIADVTAIYLRTTGGSNTTLYVKTSGSGANGWTAK